MSDVKVLCTGGSGFIGTALVDHLLKNGYIVQNIDIRKPRIEKHVSLWHYCDIRDLENLSSCFTKFQPNYVIHLAAETRTDGKHIDEYSTNTDGTRCLLQVIKNQNSVSRLIITSSQHVRKPGSGFQKNDQDFIPHGLYGESKVITENLTRDANLDCIWTIIRPTTIWGPWHPFLVDGLWRTMQKGLYIHPSNDQVVRSYGYIDNVIWQIEKILVASDDVINRKVLYIGEIPIKQISWINAFSKVITGRDVRTVPRSIIHLLAFVGDLLDLLDIKFPMQSSRYYNLTTTNPVPTKKTIDLFGEPPISLKEGVIKTTEWMKEQGKL